jgi:kinesin family protein 18/19
MEESNILVAIRVRPLNQKESQNDDWDVVRVEDNLIVVISIYRR